METANNVPLTERVIVGISAGLMFYALKLVATLGMWLGLEKLSTTILTASILGCICAVSMILTNRRKEKKRVLIDHTFA